MADSSQAQKEVQVAACELLCVVGPTASGKTDLALALARRLGGEIVSADMGQMYKRFDAGTAKPPGTWNDGVLAVDAVPYHLIDVLDAQTPSTAGLFAHMARAAIDGVLARGKRPILAGGSGLYVRALVAGLAELPRADAKVRARLMAAVQGGQRAALYAKLKAADPEAAARIPMGNTHRLVRALEVLEVSGKPISSFWAAPGAHAGYDAAYIGVAWTPAALRRRIAERAGAMFPAMLREVRALLKDGLSGEEPAFRCLGYPEALAVVRGELGEAAGLAAMIQSTRKYAKRQRTWFRRQTPTRWLEPAGGAEAWAAAYLEAAG